MSSVGWRRAGGYRYRYGGTSEIRSTPRVDVAAGRQLLDRVGRQNDEVERLARLHASRSVYAD